MTRARVTLRDVALHVGVHESTVSRVLNAKTRHMVTPEVADRVAAAADALGYRPNPIAYSLKTNRTLTVGVLIPDLTNPMFPPIIRGIQDSLERAGYTAIFANSDNDTKRERVILEAMKARRIDGLILATAHVEDPLVAETAAEEIPLVLVNRTTESDTVSSVANDDAAGIALAVRHLESLGHRRIAHVAGPQTLSTGKRRREGFIEAIRECGRQPQPSLIEVGRAFSEEAGRRALEAILARSRAFTAVVAANDMLAIGCYDALEAAGIACPEEVSVTGFNDMPFVDKLRPALTTVRIPHYEMGETAARLLLGHMADRKSRPQTILLKRELIVRGSTAPASAAQKLNVTVTPPPSRSVR